MGQAQKGAGDLILRQELKPQDGTIKNPTVLSCGGIYIPRRDIDDRILYQIITTPNQNEPVKVVTGARPRNALNEVLLKESMN